MRPAWIYEGALLFVTTMCSSNRDSPYKGDWRGSMAEGPRLSRPAWSSARRKGSRRRGRRPPSTPSSAPAAAVITRPSEAVRKRQKQSEAVRSSQSSQKLPRERGPRRCPAGDPLDPLRPPALCPARAAASGARLAGVGLNVDEEAEPEAGGAERAHLIVTMKPLVDCTEAVWWC